VVGSSSPIRRSSRTPRGPSTLPRKALVIGGSPASASNTENWGLHRGRVPSSPVCGAAPGALSFRPWWAIVLDADKRRTEYSCDALSCALQVPSSSPAPSAEAEVARLDVVTPAARLARKPQRPQQRRRGDRLTPEPSPSEKRALAQRGHRKRKPENSCFRQRSVERETLRHRAWELADRYCGQLQRLRKGQATWRKQHDRLMEKRHAERQGSPEQASQGSGSAWAAGGLDEIDINRDISSSRLSFSRTVSPGSASRVSFCRTVSPWSGSSSGDPLTEKPKARLHRLSPRLSLTRGMSLPSPEPGSSLTDSTELRDFRVDSQGLLFESLLENRASMSFREGGERRASRLIGSPVPGRRGSCVPRRASMLWPSSGSLTTGSLQDEALSASGSQSLRSADASPRLGPTEVDAIRLAKKYQLTLHEVRQRLEEFRALDTEKRGSLTRAQVSQSLRARQPSTSTEIPPTALHLLDLCHMTDAEGTEVVGFEDFLSITQCMAFEEDAGSHDRKVRALAKRYDMSLSDVEIICTEFDRFDTNGNGVIDKGEFECVIRSLLRAKEASSIPKARLDRYWVDADISGDGAINFSEFIQWYAKHFLASKEGVGQGGTLASNVYRKLGTERLSSYFRAVHAGCALEASMELGEPTSPRNVGTSSDSPRRSIFVSGVECAG